MIIYQNGQYIKEEEARISPFDHGFLYGMGLFETIRIYKGHPFLLDDHLLRLKQGLLEMNIKATLTKKSVVGILNQLLERNELQDARVRINISAGKGAVGLTSGPYEHPNIIVFMSSLPSAQEEIMQKEATILQMRRNTPETSYRLKSHHFFNNVAAKMELNERPNVEGIFLTKEGYVSEAITSNIFWVKNSILFTPELSTGILPGITRQFVIVLAKKKGFTIKEGCFFVEELLGAEEVFLTNSIQEIVAINRIDDTTQCKGKDGVFINTLYEAYKTYRTKLWSSATLT